MAVALHMLYLVGEPGVGKTTLATYLTGNAPVIEHSEPFAMREYSSGVIELGRRRDLFGGTDALAMNVQPKVETWLEQRRWPLVFAEGDRLGNGKFLQRAQDLGYTLHVVQVWGAEAAARQRAERGTGQNETWVKGRITKVTALRKAFGGTIVPAGKPPAEQAARLTDPVSAALLRGRGEANGFR